ncbi:MAG: glutathione S-transferase family protein [Sphingomonas sp.]
MLELFGHPFSSYTWKALIALYENDTPFTFRQLGPDQPETGAEFVALWPIAKFPLLRDGDRTIGESTAIIEYLDALHPGAVRLVPNDPIGAVEVRMVDRVFDNYVMTPMNAVVANAMRPEGERDPYGVRQAETRLDAIYGWLDERMGTRHWAAAEDFSMADCAAAPSLFYADWVHPIGERFPALAAYRARLLARPSVARCVEGARPYRPLFPLGAPDRD